MMSSPVRTSAPDSSHSLIRISDLSDIQVKSLLELALKLEQSKWSVVAQSGLSEKLSRKVMVEAFFEPSTRTRLSFQMAAQRLGIKVVGCDFENASSLVKGEAESDTLLNLAALNPDVLVVRSKGGEDILTALGKIAVPILNAGFGSVEHPTQALLDLLTLTKYKGEVSGLKILIVGDVPHSRVAASNIQIFQRFGMKVAVCGPDLDNYNSKGVEVFNSLNDGAAWAEVVMGLRIQLERLDPKEKDEFLVTKRANYIKNYRLDPSHLKGLSPNGLIMHPGPFVPGVDFDSELLSDKRCVVHEQVSNGVFIRGALLLRALGLQKELA